MATQSGWNDFAKGLGDAIADIREKAYEEAWFGRVVTERGDGPNWTEATEQGQGIASPLGMSGDVLPPEWQPAESSSAPQIEYGQVIENDAAQWSKSEHSQIQEQDQDRDIDNGIDR